MEIRRKQIYKLKPLDRIEYKIDFNGDLLFLFYCLGCSTFFFILGVLFQISNDVKPDIFVLVFDLKDSKTIDRIHYYIDQIKSRMIPTNFIIVGNKCDIVHRAEAKHIMQKVRSDIESINYNHHASNN